MKKQLILILLFLVTLTSCRYKNDEIAKARRQVKASVRLIKNELKGVLFLTFRKDRRLELKAMIALLDSSIESAINDLKKPQSPSISKSIFYGLKKEIDYLKKEIEVSSVKKDCLVEVRKQIEFIDQIINKAQVQFESIRYNSINYTSIWQTWFSNSLKQEEDLSQMFIAVKDELENESQRSNSPKKSKMINTLGRIITMRSEFMDLLNSQDDKNSISEELWGTLKYSAIRSVVMNDLAIDTISKMSAFNFLPTSLIEFVNIENDDGGHKCKIKAVNGDEAGTASGSVGNGSSQSGSDNIKCVIGKVVVPPPPPKPN